MISPATPMLAVIGWGLSFLLDPSHKERRAIAGMQADQIDKYAEQMRQAAKSDEVYQEILQAANGDNSTLGLFIPNAHYILTDNGTRASFRLGTLSAHQVDGSTGTDNGSK